MKKIIDAYTKNKKIVFVSLTLLFFVLIFILNKIYPLYFDDWVYSLTWNGADRSYVPHRVNSLLDIFQTQCNLYHQWTGRVVLHGINQFLLMLNPYLKYLINTSAYIIYIYIIYKYCKRSVFIQNSLYLIIFCSSFLLLPNLLETTIWTTGSANYLWGTLILILYIYPYYKFTQESFYNNKIGFSIVFGLLGIIAGGTNENTVLSTICVLFVYIYYLKKSKTKIPQWMIFGLVGLIIGAVFMLVAPGNFNRVQIYTHESSMTFLDLIKTGSKNIYHIYKHWVLVGLSSLTIVFYLVACSKKLLKKQNKLAIVGLFLMAHISIFAMVGSMYFPLRVTFFATTLLSITTIKLYNILFLKFKIIYNYFVIVILCLCFIKSYIIHYDVVYEFNEIIKRRIEFIEMEKKNGQLDIVITEMIDLPKEFNIEDISSDSTFWANITYRNYFRINSIRSSQ